MTTHTATVEASERPEPTTQRATPWRRRVWRVTRSALFIYIGVIVVLYALQSWLVFPGHATQGTRAAIVPPGGDYELLDLRTSDGVTITAIFGTALSPDGDRLPDPGSRPTLIFFYGNGMSMADCMGEFRKFRKLGANVLIPDFAGYGMSGGKPSEQSFYATADACWGHLVTRPDVDPTKIVPAGWSIGAGVAVELASRKPVAGLVTFSAFTSMPDMGRQLLPWLPTSLLLKHRFENEQKLRQIDVPALIIHGRDDRIIPFRMSERLAAAAKGSVTTLWVDTDHNDLFDLGQDQILPALGQFLADIPSRR